MKNLRVVYSVITCCCLLSANSYAATNDEIAKEIANLFLSIKIVLAESQPLINNPDKGDKGLTAERVIESAKENYATITGNKFELSNDPQIAKYQSNLFLATETVMNEAQPLINMQGVGFKGFITAIFAKNLAREFSKLSSDVNFKFTAPIDVLRSRENMPDDWEVNTFSSKFSSPTWNKSQVYTETQGNQFRWMIPLYHEEGCMSCHGSPKGEIDITGHSKEGAQVGDLAGAFSIILNQ